MRARATRWHKCAQQQTSVLLVVLVCRLWPVTRASSGVRQLVKRGLCGAVVKPCFLCVERASAAGVSPKALFELDWAERAATLRAAMSGADAQRVNTNRAKRLLREIQAYAAAREATAGLDAVMAKSPCGAAPLRGALTRFEAAFAAVTGAANPMLPPSSTLVGPRVSSAKSRLELEKAAEALAREAKSAKAVEHLPRLEAAILTAKRVGAEALDADSYAAASEMRERLAHAFKVRLCPPLDRPLLMLYCAAPRNVFRSRHLM
jgi:hypothetical protein